VTSETPRPKPRTRRAPAAEPTRRRKKPAAGQDAPATEGAAAAGEATGIEEATATEEATAIEAATETAETTDGVASRDRVMAAPARALPPIEELVRAARGEASVAEPEASRDASQPGFREEPETAQAPGPVQAHLATPAELADWDARTVHSPHGHVYQSRAWSDYRAAHGWHTWHVAFDDGFRLLVLGRPGGTGAGAAYASRGPLPERDAARSAARAVAAAEILEAQGVPALTVDGETPAASGLREALSAAGFHLTEEEQASRHRMDVYLGPDDAPNSDEKTIFASFGATTRNLIRQADRHGLKVRRLDAGGGRIEDDGHSGMLDDFEPVDLGDGETVDGMLRTFYEMLDATAKRRGFALASEDKFLDWSRRGIGAGYTVYLQAEHPEDGPVAGASFYRHGHRLTYSLAGDRAELRRKYPGAVRLLLWRGIQIALDERRTVVDLGGIDTEGARDKPDKGDPTYGMYQFKESFGARWVEMTGAHKKTMRPMASLAGRVLGKLSSLRR
jgi:lipid II:glycine glycyltransferase (peptidoglycan interpeptide bridge formation enzyme)